MLGTTQLGQILGKESKFFGVRSRKDVAECEVDHTAEQWNTTRIAQQTHRAV